jgi:RNA recognition motif-containing protein
MEDQQYDFNELPVDKTIGASTESDASDDALSEEDHQPRKGKTKKSKTNEDDETTLDKLAKRKRKQQEKQEKKERKKQRLLGESDSVKKEFSVWAGNLAYFTQEDAVRQFFHGCGEIVRLDLPMQSKHKCKG